MLEPGEVVAGRLRIVRVLGAGGMGAVYEVEHQVTKHRRALKLLHAQFAKNPAVVARFLNEASAAGRIGNPHIVETFDGGQLESGEPYLVMEMLDGESLRDLLDAHGARSLEEAVDLLTQACVGIRAAHEAGIVHRDLKPDNLFVARGQEPFVKILDFGVSKFDPELTGAQPLTSVGGVLGTPHYMPPEQMRGEEVGPSADVYALGVILYECLCGQRPFDAETLPHLSVLIHEGKPTPPSELRADLPPALDQVIRRAMATEPSHRYQTVAAFSESLQLALSPDHVDFATQLPNGESPRRSGLPTAQPAVTDRPPALDAETLAAAEPRRRSAAIYLALGVVGVLGLGAVALGVTRAPVGAEPQRAERPVPQDAPSTPAVTQTPPTASASPPPPPSAEASAAPPKLVSTASASPPGTTSAAKPSTRAEKHGLAQENPF